MRRYKFWTIVSTILIASNALSAQSPPAPDPSYYDGSQRGTSAKAKADAARRPFGSFEVEQAKVTSKLNCRAPRVVQGKEGEGAMYVCDDDVFKHLMFHIHQHPTARGQVGYVFFFWHDSTRELGHGTPPDSALAKKSVMSLADLYAPKQSAEVLRLFFGSKNGVITSETHVLTYTYQSGSEAEGRQFFVTAK